MSRKSKANLSKTRNERINLSRKGKKLGNMPRTPIDVKVVGYTTPEVIGELFI